MRILNRLYWSVVIILAMVGKSTGQGYQEAVRNLNLIYADYGASTVSEPITFDSLKSILVIDNYEVPISDDTFIQCVKNRSNKEGMRYSAKFYMQQGEIITLKGNDMIKKAFLAIPISNKQTCKRFTFYLEQLKKEY